MGIFYAQLNDGSSMKKEATHMEVVNEAMYVWRGETLVAYLDLSAVIFAHIY